MVKTQFFDRKYDDLEAYKSNFKKALVKIKTVNLFSDEVINFLNNWIDKQKSYIQREDVDNLLSNINLVFKDKEFYEYCLEDFSKVQNNWNVLEYSFNLISTFDDLVKDYKKFKNKKEFEENLIKQKEVSRKKDEEDIKKLMEEL